MVYRFISVLFYYDMLCQRPVLLWHALSVSCSAIPCLVSIPRCDYPLCKSPVQQLCTLSASCISTSIPFNGYHALSLALRLRMVRGNGRCLKRRRIRQRVNVSADDDNDPTEPCEDKHCLTCHGPSQLVCMLVAHYEPCADDSMCFRQQQTFNHRESVRYGCMATSECEAENAIGTGCSGEDTSPCLVCDNDGEINPPPPYRDISVCGTPSYDTCSCKGDPHCSTFMNSPVEVGGVCSHVLSQDGCGTSPQSTYTVSIELGTLRPGRTTVRAVKIQYAGLLMELGQGNVIIGGANMDMTGHDFSNPYIQSGVHFYSMASDSAVRVNLPNGIEVVWDFDRTVAVYKPKDFPSDVCGICGGGTPETDLIIGPVASASTSCFGAQDVLAGLSTGAQMSPGEDLGFTYSHIYDVTDGECEDFCNA